MLKIFQFFFPKIILKENSPINRKIEVVEQFGKRSIRVQGLEQSGPMIEKIWEKGIKAILRFGLLRGGPAMRGLVGGVNLQKRKAPLVDNILILGLGGGSAVKVVNKYFPQAEILGIELDPLMIKIGKKHLSLSGYKDLEIKIADAFEWLRTQKLSGLNHFTKYDLVLVDLYLGRKLPQGLESEAFLKNIKALLSKNGVVIFNRLRKKEKKAEFKIFLDKLKKIYHHIKVIKPVINYLIICSQD